MKRWFLSMALVAGMATPAPAQSDGFVAPCAEAAVPQSARETCVTVAQAVASAQPRLGILLAGGNPTLGTASGGGFRLGFLPGVSATAKVNLVLVRLPDIIAEEAGGAAAHLNERVGIPAPALSGSVSVPVFAGFDVLPMVGGLGSIDLLGTASWLPLRALGQRGIGEGTSDVSLGAGARVGLLRESFFVPGVSVSLMYHRLEQLAYGDVCPGAAAQEAGTGEGYRVSSGNCLAGGSPGEFGVDIASWSARGAVSKRLLGLGLTGGVGYDRFASDVNFGLRAPPGTPEGAAGYFVRIRDHELTSGRWSAFVNGSFTLLVATLGVEAGWLQGDQPLPGFAEGGAFDPRSGTFFGSLGLRLSL